MNRFDIEQLNGTLKGKMRISSSWQSTRSNFQSKKLK